MAITRSRSVRGNLVEPAAKKPRTVAASAASAERDESTPVWLDLLPSDVCERIAASVSGGQRTRDALHLAQTSVAQGRAVVTALSHAFVLDRDASEDDLAWMSVFVPAVRKVSVTSAFGKLSSRLRSAALALLLARSLQCAQVPDDPRVLRTVARATALQELHVALLEDGPWPMDATRLLMRTLAALRLRKLVLVCSAPWESQCPLKRIETLAGSRYALARCCPDLAVFQIYGCLHGGDSYWTIWNTLGHIREVVLTGHPPDWVIPRLRTLQSVKIGNMVGAVRLASCLGKSVTHLRGEPILSATEIPALSECKNMSRLWLVLDKGNECSVLEAVTAMSNLNSLTLEWTPELQPPIVVEYVHPYGHPLRRILLSRFVEVTAGVLPRLVQQVPTLTRLDILHVRVRLSEVVAILKHIGSRLKHFGVSFVDQDESSVERFKTIVETIVKHNRELRTVSAGVVRMPWGLRIHVSKNRNLTNAEAEQLKRRKAMLGVLRSRVKSCIPFLDAESLESWINAVQWVNIRENVS